MPYEFPAEIDPPRLSVCVPVPDDENHKRAFLGQIDELTRWWTWGDEPSGTGKLAAAAVWQEIYLLVSDRLWAGEECGDEMDCCDQILNAIQTSTAALQNTLRGQLYDGTPGSVNPSAPGHTFSQNEEGVITDNVDRLTALCLAVKQYVYNRVLFAMYALAAASGAAIGIGGGLIIVGGPLAWIVGAVAAVVGALGMQALTDAANDQEALDEMICQLYEMLDGVPITQDNFTAALGALSASTANEQTILTCLLWNPDITANYLYFIDLLGAGYQQAQAGADNDCCDDLTCEFDFAVSGYGMEVRNGSRTPGEGYKNTSNDVGWELFIQKNFGDLLPCSDNPIYFRITYSYSGASGSASWFVLSLYDSTGTKYTSGVISGTTGTNQVQTGQWSAGGNGDWYGIGLRKWNGASSGNFTLHKIELAGTPF
jgi:hypothetical protein